MAAGTRRRAERRHQLRGASVNGGLGDASIVGGVNSLYLESDFDCLALHFALNPIEFIHLERLRDIVRRQIFQALVRDQMIRPVRQASFG